MAMVVKGAALIDGTGREPIRKPSVVIEGGRFRQILAGDDPAAPSDAEVLDLGEATLLPGLIDAHEHLGLRFERGYERGQMVDPEHEIAFRMAKSALEDIRGGVTSVRTVGDKCHLDLVCKKYIDTGYIPGPRVYPSGAGIRPSHGHGATATTVADGVDAVRKAVREHVFKGSHHIKLFTTGGTGTIGTDPSTTYYTREEHRAAIEEAHNVGRKIMAHCHGGLGADWALELGMDSIEHGAWMTEEQIARMAGSSTWFVPTLTVGFHPKDPNSPPKPPDVAEKGRQARERWANVARTAIQAGVKIGAGLDSWHGELWFEMDLLVQFGKTPMEAIKIATHDNAELLGELQDLGTVEEGKFADIIAVQGNPLQDVKHVKNVCLVLKEGVRFV